MKKYVAAFALLLALAVPALAQWQVPDHAVPIGRGPGFTGFKNAAPGTAGAPLVSNGAASDPSFQVVPNSGLAAMAANTVKCNPTTSTANAQDCAYLVLNVKDYGAACNGAGDDSTAINNAIAALPASGGIVEFPATNCRITSTINIGNGTSSTASTRQGVVLRGVGNPNTQPTFPGFTPTAGPKITWAGSGAVAIITVNGPLQGWGVQNLSLDCASIANAVGISVISGQFGDSRNLTIDNCFRGISSTTVALFGSFTNTDSFNNKWYQTSIRVPATSGAMGIILTGADSTTNTDYNTFTNTDVFLPTSVVVVVGIYLQVSDTNHFINTHVYGANASANCISFDYSVSNSFPSANRFTGVDTGTCNGGGSFTIGGTPGAGGRPNQLYVDPANGTICPLLVNTSCTNANEIVTNPGGNNIGTDILGAWATFTPSPVCGSATFTTATGRRLTMGKTTFISLSIVVNALGTCAGTLTFTLPNTNQVTGAIPGQNSATGFGVTCRLNNTTTATCSQDGAQAFAAGFTLFLSGVYENQ